MIDLLMPTIAQGLLWAIMALGVYITYRVLDIADLTVEGSFPLGAAVAASLLAGGYSPWLAFGAAMLAGMLAGVATGLLHTKLKIPALLAGILTMIALYSVNLRVMGKANLSLLRVDTVFSIMRDIGCIVCGYRQLIFDRRFDLLVFWYGNRRGYSCYRL